MKTSSLLISTLVSFAATLVASEHQACANNAEPVGTIDSFDGSTVKGWACLVGSPGSVAVEVYTGTRRRGACCWRAP